MGMFARGFCVLAVLALSACGGSGSSTSSGAPTAQATISGIPALATFPDKDTPIGAAAYNLQQQWLAYGVSVIPSRHIFDTAPSPTISNQTPATVSDGAARAMVVAHVREGLLEQWADLNQQTGLRFHLFSPVLSSGPEEIALNQGQSVHGPNCLFFGVTTEVHAMSEGDRRFFTGLGSPTKATNILVDQEGDSPCVVTATTSTGTSTNVETLPASSRLIYAGNIVDDPVLGAIWRYDAAATCASANAPVDLCQPPVSP